MVVGVDSPEFSGMDEEFVRRTMDKLMDYMVRTFVAYRQYILQVNAKEVGSSTIRVDYLLRLYDVDREEKIPSDKEVEEYVNKVVDVLFTNKPLLASMFEKTDVASSVLALLSSIMKSSEKRVFLNSALATVRMLANLVIAVAFLKEIYTRGRYELMPVIEQFDPELANSIRTQKEIFESFKPFIPGKIADIWTGNLDVYEVEYQTDNGSETRYLLGIDYIIDIDMRDYIMRRLADCRGNMDCEKELMPEIQQEISDMVDTFLCMNKDTEDEFKQCVMGKMMGEEQT